MIDKLVAECTENIDEVEIAEIASIELQAAGHENVSVCSYAICVMFVVIALAISIGSGAYLAYFRWFLKKDSTYVKFGTRTQ